MSMGTALSQSLQNMGSRTNYKSPFPISGNTYTSGGSYTSPQVQSTKSMMESSYSNPPSGGMDSWRNPFGSDSRTTQSLVGTGYNNPFPTSGSAYTTGGSYSSPQVQSTRSMMESSYNPQPHSMTSWRNPFGSDQRSVQIPNRFQQSFNRPRPSVYGNYQNRAPMFSQNPFSRPSPNSFLSSLNGRFGYNGALTQPGMPFNMFSRGFHNPNINY